MQIVKLYINSNRLQKSRIPNKTFYLAIESKDISFIQDFLETSNIKIWYVSTFRRKALLKHEEFKSKPLELHLILYLYAFVCISEVSQLPSILNVVLLMNWRM